MAGTPDRPRVPGTSDAAVKNTAEPQTQEPKAIVDPVAHYEPSSNSTKPTTRSVQEGEAPRAKRTKRRRVTTQAPTGSDPHPTKEPERLPANENDERLKGDKPPHWG